MSSQLSADRVRKRPGCLSDRNLARVLVGNLRPGEEQLREVALVKIIVPAQKSNPRWEATRQLAPMIRLRECQRPGPSIVSCRALSVDDA